MRRHLAATAAVLGASIAVAAGVATSDNHASKCKPGLLPDSSCTPGATNPAVTQANIDRTICVRGWTRTVRPPATYTTPLKIRQMKDYGLTGESSTYEEDHLIPLEVGGNPTDPQNLWPEPWPDARKKDKRENALRKLVCAHTMSLHDAQTLISSDWTKVPVG